jgi:hypothetical protein
MEESKDDANQMDEWTQRQQQDMQQEEVDSIVATGDDADDHSDDLLIDASAHTDDDNWSQQVETDEILRMSSSAILEDSIPRDSILSNSADPSTLSMASNLAPQRHEPTLKEKLVERERQRRVETERARLKRQFALSSNDGGAVDEDSAEQDGGSVLRENGSIAGTVGEGSSVAFLDSYDEEGQNLTYPMERFLQEQGAVIEEEAVRDTTRDSGVVMERFRKEPVVVADPQGPSDDRNNHIDRSVSFDMEPHVRDEPLPGTTGPPAPSSIIDRAVVDDPRVAILSEGLGSDTDGALRTDSMRARQLSVSESPSVDRFIDSDQPRFLRLTEAEIQEMASIDEMSRSNGPPSERDDMSESSFVGELISDFGGPVMDTAGSASQGTGTTAMESASGDHSHSGRDVSEQEDSHSIDAPATASVSSHIFSSAGASVAANPPSDIDGDEPPLSPLPSPLGNLDHRADEPAGERSSGIASNHELNDHGPHLDLREPGPGEPGIVNRQIRPGMIDPRRLHGPPSTPMRRSASAPRLYFEVDDFDYDKDIHSPASGLVGQDDIANDLWSPGSNMSWSPPYRKSGAPTSLDVPELPVQRNNYGALDDRDSDKLSNRSPLNDHQPLLPHIPKEIVASPRSQLKPVSAMHNIFRQIRFNNTGIANVAHADTQQYAESSRLNRGEYYRIRAKKSHTSSFSHNWTLAFPERLMVLAVTLLIEVPVLFTICGGSDQLCNILGRSKYQLMIGFLPICTALSGNVGLQSSALTIHAVAHGMVTRETFSAWILKEIGASLYLGVAMGTVVGAIAFWLSGFHLVFALTIMISQFVSILSAGLTGTLAPLVSTFLFDHKAQSWNGPLETAIQDLIGSFALVVISYKILQLLGPMEVDPSDSCGWGNY